MAIPSHYVRLTLDFALKKCNDSYPGRAICVSICDNTGLLLGFIRMDHSPVRCISISQAKAYTAVRMQSSTTAFQQRLEREKLCASDFCDSVLTPIPGGHPIQAEDGVILGAVGVSGLAPAEDAALAEAAAAFAVKNKD